MAVATNQDIAALVILTRVDVLNIAALCPSRPWREPVTLVDAEREHILKALEQSNWVVSGKSGAAASLGMKRTKLADRMRKRGISREIFQGSCGRTASQGQ